MDEHYWKFKPVDHAEGVARGFEQQLKVTTETPAPSICALKDGVWCLVVGPWVAEEMLRLATANSELERKLDFHMREAALAKARVSALTGDLRRLRDNAVAANHDLSVKLEMSEARRAELERSMELSRQQESGLRAGIHWFLDEMEGPDGDVLGKGAVRRILRRRVLGEV